jgi:hypothetical protein
MTDLERMKEFYKYVQKKDSEYCEGKQIEYNEVAFEDLDEFDLNSIKNMMSWFFETNGHKRNAAESLLGTPYNIKRAEQAAKTKGFSTLTKWASDALIAASFADTINMSEEQIIKKKKAFVMSKRPVDLHHKINL